MEQKQRDAIKAAQTMPLEEKIYKAIALLQGNEMLTNGLGYYLAFSGGKDSVVIKELARMAGVKFDSWYNQTTIDPPELVRFIQKEHPEVSWNRVGIPLPYRMAIGSKGPPSRINRWCCDIYKEQGGTGRVKIIGVRVAESPRRAATWAQLVPNRNGGHIICPILYWTDEDIWTFIKHYNIPYCSLYDEGYKRLGCIGCPMGNEKQQRAQFKRWPGFEKMWQRGFQMYWEKYAGTLTNRGEIRASDKKFKNWKDHWDWWLSGKGYDKWADECQYSMLYV